MHCITGTSVSILLDLQIRLECQPGLKFVFLFFRSSEKIIASRWSSGYDISFT